MLFEIFGKRAVYVQKAVEKHIQTVFCCAAVIFSLFFSSLFFLFYLQFLIFLFDVSSFDYSLCPISSHSFSIDLGILKVLYSPGAQRVCTGVV